MEYLVNKNFCPMHHQARYMWFANMKDGSTIFEYDDRRDPHWSDTHRDDIMNWAANSVRQYSENDIGFAHAIKSASVMLIKELNELANPDKPLEVKESLYDNLDQSQVKELGIMGCGKRIYFDTNTGTFMRDDNTRVDIYLVHNDKKYELSGRSDMNYSELFERHEMSFHFTLGNQENVPGTMDGMTVGYPVSLELDDDIKLDVQVLYTVPTVGDHYVRLVFNTNKDTSLTVHLLNGDEDLADTVDIISGDANEFTIVL